MADILQDLKGLTEDFLASDGETIMEKPRGTFGKMKLDNRQITFFRLLIDFLFNTNYIKEKTKYFIRNKSSTVEEVAKVFRQNGAEADTERVRIDISGDRRWITRDLGQNIVSDVIENRDIQGYEVKLNKKMVGYSRMSELDIVIPLPKVLINIHAPDDFQKNIRELQIYSMRGMNVIASTIPKDVIGYIEFLLLPSSLLSEEDKKNKKMMLNLLGKKNKCTEQKNNEEAFMHLPESIFKKASLK